MEKSDVIIGIAQLYVAKAPGKIITIGLGSCVGVTLYDPITQIGGMVHIMLSDSTTFTIGNKTGNVLMKGKYADTGIKELLDQMIAAGACRTNLVAKMAGGAKMFEVKEGNDALSIGDKNVEAVRAVLDQNNIRLVAEDTGADYGRTIELNLDDGSLLVKTVTQGIKNM
jgi:chemotaxis protein CheD